MRDRVLTLSLTDLAELVLNQAYRIAGNFAGAKFHGNASRFFTVCIFVEWMHDTLITPPPVVAHAPHKNPRNNTEQRSQETSLHNDGLVFLTCGGLCNYDTIKTTHPNADLNCDNLGASLMSLLIFSTVAGSFSLQQPFRGQTDSTLFTQVLVRIDIRT